MTQWGIGMNDLTRFKCASDAIDFKRLEKETQKILFLGLLVAISAHAAIGSYFMFKKTEVKVVKPPTMELVIRRPRMTKAFEFKKKRIQQRVLQRKQFAQQQPTKDIETKSIDTSFQLAGSVTSYEFDSSIDTNTETETISFEAVDLQVETSRKPENQISMKDEMISIHDLDTGQFKAIVVQDPLNKQDIQGFIYVANAWSSQLRPPNDLKRSLLNLSEAVNRYTRIDSKVDRHLYLDDKRIFDVPFVYLVADDSFELTENEADNFGEYLRNGGFCVCDNGTPAYEFGKAEASLRQALKDALGPDAKFLPIPNDHPLYHCFFDFDDGPPIGSEVAVINTISTGFNTADSDEFKSLKILSKEVIYLEGIWLGDRLVAIYSDKGYAVKWKEYSDNEPQLKIGVNMVVFALTQSGGIAQRKMDFFATGL